MDDGGAVTDISVEVLVLLDREDELLGDGSAGSEVTVLVGDPALLVVGEGRPEGEVLRVPEAVVVVFEVD